MVVSQVPASPSVGAWLFLLRSKAIARCPWSRNPDRDSSARVSDRAAGGPVGSLHGHRRNEVLHFFRIEQQPEFTTVDGIEQARVGPAVDALARDPEAFGNLLGPHDQPVDLLQFGFVSPEDLLASPGILGNSAVGADHFGTLGKSVRPGLF